MSADTDILAHRLAEAIARRWAAGAALGAPSLYNVSREVIAPALDDLVDGMIEAAVDAARDAHREGFEAGAHGLAAELRRRAGR